MSLSNLYKLVVTREVAMACRCQLLTGSYEGATRSCPCERSDCCKLSVGQRRRLQDNPKVLEAKERNQREFEELNKEGE